MTKWPRASRPMSLLWGRIPSETARNPLASAVRRAAGLESAMTCQWYTTRAMTPPARAAGAPGRLAIQHLGHVSLFVRELGATRRFYRDVLGLTETGTGKQGRIVFFSAGVRHHDLSCELARSEGP